jgi:hypothetical protein
MPKKSSRKHMKPEEFEQEVARIISVLEGQDAVVNWNARIPDPDNSAQLRQVDITIRREGRLSLVECRLHTRPQDVQWVEELFGRRASLGAETIMGVSASGFTKGAWAKAQRLGVFLREFHDLSNEEVALWGLGTKVRLSYVHFNRVKIFAVASQRVIISRPNPRTVLLKKDGQPTDLDGLFRNVANSCAKDGTPEGIIRIKYLCTDLFIGSLAVPEVVIQVDWKWLHREHTLPVVTSFGQPQRDWFENDVVIESDRFSRSEILHCERGAVTVIDVSIAPPEPRSYLRTILFDFGKPVRQQAVGMIGIGEPQTSLFPFKLYVLRRESSEYQRLFPDDHAFSVGED